MKMKSLKAQFIGAIAMVLVAAIAMGSSTYAWFAMNTEVHATGMNVKAAAENGLIISDIDGNNWSATANAKVANGTALLPTSHGIVANTDDGWYHNSSTDADNAVAYAAATHTTLNLTYSNTTNSVAHGSGFVDTNGNNSADTGEGVYVLKNRFLIKTSAEEMDQTNLVIKNITVTSSEGSGLIPLDTALRVAIVAGGNTYIYAPVESVTTTDGGTSVTTTPTYTYKVNKNTTTTKAYKASADTAQGSDAFLAGKDLKCTGITKIPAFSATPIPVDVYIYYEGEDLACKSSNINGVTVDQLSVTIDFTTASVS